MSSPNLDTSERRDSSRKILRVPVVLEIPGRAPVELRTIELSAGGLAMACPVNLASGLSCQIRFNLPGPAGQAPIQARASVIHSVLSQRDGGFRVGFQFNGLESTHASRIQAYLKG
jgi:c-di-GMP-binding flagellar brake protein YcgR